jgi:beta-N-acetylhexosaminidase
MVVALCWGCSGMPTRPDLAAAPPGPGARAGPPGPGARSAGQVSPEAPAPEATAPPATETSRTPVGAPPAPAACVPLRAALAQLLLVGFPGTEPSPQNLAVVHEGVGGLVLYDRNIVSADQLRSLVRGLQAVAPVPMEIAVDEEPGRIARLAGIIPGSLSARGLGLEVPDDIRSLAQRIGADLGSLGVTTDLAPVLDVTSAPANSIIGDRSFGGDPGVVNRAGVAFAQGLQASGITGVGKHFPGHGESDVDSHQELPVVDADLPTIASRDLPPFERAINAGLPAVMIGHLLIPALDRNLPASLSPAAISLLRGQLGFSGVAVTDGLEMSAIAARWDLPEASELALRAGVDQLLIWKDYPRIPEVLDHLTQAAQTNRLSIDRIREAFERVTRMKGQLSLSRRCISAA